jgi:hypothetical protein
LNAPVLALGDDRVRVSAGEEITQDDNVFRVSPAAAPSGGGEDTYRTTSVALDVDVPVEEQRFQGNFAVNSQRYDRFDALDLDAHDGSVRWLWKAGGNVDGTIGYRDTLALASLANVQAGVQTAIPNTLDTRASVLETVYRPAARWRLRGGWRSTDQANSAIEYRISDANIDALEAEADYVTRADNRLGLVIRSADGRLPNQQIVGTTFVDNSYSERSIAVLAQWAVTSKSRVAASVGRFERSYAQLPQRGYTGPTYDAKYEWRPTGRVVLEVSAHHGLSPYEEVQVGFVLSRLSLGLGDKVTLSLEGEQAHRTYLGDAGLVLGSLPPTSEDLALRSLAVSYKPTPKVELTATLYDAKRVSTLQFSSYSVDTGTLGVRVRF